MAGLALCSVAAATSAQATTEVNHYRVRGNYAQANAYGGNECSNTWVDFSAHDQVFSNEPGRPQSESGAWVNFGSYDWCTGRNINGSAFVKGVELSRRPSELTVDLSFEAYEEEWRCDGVEPTPDPVPTPRPLGDVTAPVADPTGEPKPPPPICYPVITATHQVHIAATLTPTGQAYRSNGTYHWRWANGAYHNRSVGLWQDAEVAGDVTLDGVPIELFGAWGQLGSTNEGQVSITRW